MKKEQILEELLKTDGYLSGEELGRKMNCTRAAVSGIINKLRDEGYTIDSVTNRGYRLTGTPNVLTPELVAAHLQVFESEALTLLFADKGRKNICQYLKSQRRPAAIWSLWI